MFKYDESLGFLHTSPYANLAIFKQNETITVKPGFKIWVDGGLVQYDLGICYAKSLDCSATCCLQSYCAPTKNTCINYKRRSYNEVYIGITIVTLIVAGIPTCILTVEFILNFKFCSQYDEEAETILGGMTILEAITYMLTCGES